MIDQLKYFVEQLCRSIYQQELRLVKLEQYSRFNCLFLHGCDANFQKMENEELENYVIDTLNIFLNLPYAITELEIDICQPVAYAGFWKGGGYFERVRSVQTTLTRIFIDLEVSDGLSVQTSVSDGLSETWGEMSRKARKFKAFFRPKLGDLQKKKRSSPKFRVIFRPKSEIQRFLLPKIRWSPIKKVFAKIQSDFSAEIRNSKVFSAQN